MKPFDLPYNFDKELIDFYKIFFKGSEDMVHSIYLPPLRDEYLTAKNFTKIIPYRVGQPIQPTNISIFDYIPTQEYFYFKHIAKINEAFPNKICLLLQHTKELMDIYTLEKYVEAGISKFCVGSINQVKLLKINGQMLKLLALLQ